MGVELVHVHNNCSDLPLDHSWTHKKNTHVLTSSGTIYLDVFRSFQQNLPIFFCCDMYFNNILVWRFSMFLGMFNEFWWILFVELNGNPRKCYPHLWMVMHQGAPKPHNCPGRTARRVSQLHAAGGLASNYWWWNLSSPRLQRAQ